jgi:cytochrome bd quinol oxidase subunit 1 apoprotein (EC 1.10.3.-)
MTQEALLLSRLQFVWVIAWHILLPAFTVGLASFVAFMEGLYFATRRETYLRISSFWTKIFSVSFAMGVVSGIIMPFQFGTNWSRFSDATANIISPLLAYEGLTAFFLEAAFLGVLLFGRSLVPRWVHFFAALMVAAGCTGSPRCQPRNPQPGVPLPQVQVAEALPDRKSTAPTSCGCSAS